MCNALNATAQMAPNRTPHTPSLDASSQREIRVTARRRSTLPGFSATLDQRNLEQHGGTNPEAQLRRLPAVTVRTEDGFGLRPNIGLRAASSERSKKITLMEDGVLFAPAPYSAPAAYYFPLLSRMSGVRVMLGSSAIPYGPHTIGGAIDWTGRKVPQEKSVGGGFDLSLGNTWYQKADLHAHASLGWMGVLFEYARLGSEGFKTVDENNIGTGFERNEMNLKLMLRSDETNDGAPRPMHLLEGTAGFSNERSNETYLGLTDQDFRANPFRRYAISAPDNMRWERWSGVIKHTFTLQDFSLVSTAYRHDMSRTWYRFDGFRDGTSVFDVLRNQGGLNSIYLETMKLERDSTTDDLQMTWANNQRTFASQGIQMVARGDVQTQDARHHIEGGARLHNDWIARNHTGEVFESRDGVRTDTGARLNLANNRDETTALSLHASYELSVSNFTLAFGMRSESIFGTREEAGRTGSLVQQAWLPGGGVKYDLLTSDTETLELVGGVYRGFSPATPSASNAGVEPEYATNVEAGARWDGIAWGDQLLQGSMFYFLTEYENMLSSCSASSGCRSSMLDQQFNAGRVRAYGLETSMTLKLKHKDVKFPVRINYTWMRSRFDASFRSQDPQLGDVKEGAGLPYFPEHQFLIEGNVEVGQAGGMISATYTSRMLEQAGFEADPNTPLTDDQFYLDANAYLNVFDKKLKIYLKAENVLFARPLVSRRPFGARPGRPSLIMLGVSGRFDLL